LRGGEAGGRRRLEPITRCWTDGRWSWFLISLLAAFCGGLAWALDHELFAVAFAQLQLRELSVLWSPWWAPGYDVALTAARWQAPTPREERRVGALGVLPLTRTVGASTDRGSVGDASRICAAPLRAHGASTHSASSSTINTAGLFCRACSIVALLP
jgi:hypothetical protein